MLTTNTHPRRARRAPALLFTLAVAALLARAARPVLIHHMRLPRMALAQKDTVAGVALTPDGRTLLSASDLMDQRRWRHGDISMISVWDAASGRLLRRMPAGGLCAWGLTASPDNRHAAAAYWVYGRPPHSTSNYVTVWDWQTGQALWTAPGPMFPCFSPDGTKLGMGGSIYDASNGKLLCRTGANVEEDLPCRFSPNGLLYGVVNTAQTSSKMHSYDDAQWAESFYSTTRLHLWHTDTGKEARDFPFTRVRDFNFSRDGRRLVMVSDRDVRDEGHLSPSGSSGSVTRCLDMATGTVAWTYDRAGVSPDNDPDAYINSVAVSPNGKYVVLESVNTRIMVLDAATGREAFRTLIPFRRPNIGWGITGGLSFSADGSTLASRGGKSVWVWDTRALR